MTMEETEKCLNALGHAYRHDWSECDGRNIQAELDMVKRVIKGESTYEEFCVSAGIHPVSLVWV